MTAFTKTVLAAAFASILGAGASVAMADEYDNQIRRGIIEFRTLKTTDAMPAGMLVMQQTSAGEAMRFEPARSDHRGDSYTNGEITVLDRSH